MCNNRNLVYNYQLSYQPPASAATGICEGDPLNLTASGGSYNWSGNGVTTAAANPQVINGLTPSTSTYNVTVTVGNGCTITASTDITVNANLIKHQRHGCFTQAQAPP